MKEKIDIMDYAPQILKANKRGILVNTNGDKFNAMMISFGSLGTIWGKPSFTIYVREHRYTKAQLDKTGEFTLSLPIGKPIPQIVKVCGMQSGHNIDKVAAAGLTLEEPEVNHTPGIREYPLTLECRILYKQTHNLDAIPTSIREKEYPQDIDGSNPTVNRDPHTEYIAEIVSAYIIR